MAISIKEFSQWKNIPLSYNFLKANNPFSEKVQQVAYECLSKIDFDNLPACGKFTNKKKEEKNFFIFHDVMNRDPNVVKVGLIETIDKIKGIVCICVSTKPMGSIGEAFGLNNKPVGVFHLAFLKAPNQN